MLPTVPQTLMSRVYLANRTLITRLHLMQNCAHYLSTIAKNSFSMLCVQVLLNRRSPKATPACRSWIAGYRFDLLVHPRDFLHPASFFQNVRFNQQTNRTPNLLFLVWEGTTSRTLVGSRLFRFRKWCLATGHRCLDWSISNFISC